jgi:hypothetical protein
LAVAVARVTSITEATLEPPRKLIELNCGVARFIFFPSHHAKNGEPANHVLRDDNCGGEWAAATDEPILHGDKKFKLIRRLFQSVSSALSQLWGIFLGFGENGVISGGYFHPFGGWVFQDCLC